MGLLKVRFGGLHSVDFGETGVFFNTLECDVGGGNWQRFSSDVGDGNWQRLGRFTSIPLAMGQPDCPIIVAVVEMWHVAMCTKCEKP